MDRREPEREAAAAEQNEDTLPDLDVADGDDVVGGALNSYVSKLQGEKQGTRPE
jgi:hypothetical protein